MNTINTQKINREWIMLTLIMLITTDLLVVNIGGYPVVLMFALLPWWLLKSFVIKKTVRVKLFLFYIGLILIPFINIRDVSNWLEFWKSYSLLMMNAGILLFFCYSRAPRINARTIGAFVRVAQNLILVFSLLQLFELYFIGTEYLWDLWGNWSSHFTISSWAKRAKAFYHEPSHLALITIFLFWMRFIVERKLSLKNFLHCFIILALSRSGAGILIFPFIIGYIILSRYKFFIAIPLVIAFGLLLSVLIVQNQKTIYKLAKIDQLQDTESLSSGYMRWILPVKIMKIHYNEGRFLGYGLGQLESDYFQKVDELMKSLDIKDSAIANGLLSAQIQFGLFFTLFILYAFIYRYPKMNKRWRSFVFINFICLTAGSYFLVEMYFIRFFIPLLLLKSIDEKVKMEQLP